jgi:hypothetical protein
MRTSIAIGIPTLCLACFGFTAQSPAATVQTSGAGSAVSSVDRAATFDSLTSTNTSHLDNYREGGLSITTSGDNWAADFNMAAKLDPFNGAGDPSRAFYAISSGNNDWVTIETTNHALIHGIEFMYGNTWTTGDSSRPWGNDRGYVEWQTLNGGALVSSGTIGTNSYLALGTVLGFYDPVGFDQLQVKCRIENSSPPDYQALALDNVNVMLTNVPPAPIIYGDDFSVNPTNHFASLTVWDTLAVCQYRLVCTGNLASGVWVPVTPPLPGGWQAGGGTLTFTDPGAAGKPQRFYRVEVR